VNNQSQPSRPLKAGPLALQLLVLCAGAILLLVTDFAAIRDQIISIARSLLSQSSLQFISHLPIVRLYEELWPVYFVFIVLLGAIAYYEFTGGIIPDAVTIPGMVIGLGFVAGFQHISMLESLSGLIVGVVGSWALNLYWLRSRGREGLGDGIGKMQGMLGTFLGLQNSIAALALASILATVYASTFRRGPFSKYLEFGPWLALAGLLCAIVPISEVFR